MFRIDSAGSVEGQFTHGDPQIGQRATVVSADWLNAVQEEIAAVVEGAEIPLDKEDDAQLLAAIAQLISLATGEGGGEEGAVPITRTVVGAGLATGGGPLAANLTITVVKALAAAILTGTDDASAITPLQLATAFAGVKASTGYMPLPGGFIMQWGNGTAIGDAVVNMSLPTTFPTMCCAASCEGGTGSFGAQDNGPYVSGRGTNTISITTAGGTCSVNWWAIGF